MKNQLTVCCADNESFIFYVITCNFKIRNSFFVINRSGALVAVIFRFESVLFYMRCGFIVSSKFLELPFGNFNKVPILKYRRNIGNHL